MITEIAAIASVVISITTFIVGLKYKLANESKIKIDAIESDIALIKTKQAVYEERCMNKTGCNDKILDHIDDKLDEINKILVRKK